MPRVFATLPIVTVMIAALVGCTTDSNEPDDRGSAGTGQGMRVEAVWTDDSSASPERHRSWTLEADEDEIVLVVDSFGDVVAEERVPMPSATWDEFRDRLAKKLRPVMDPVDADLCGEPEGLTLDIDGTGDDALDVSYDVRSWCGSETETNTMIIDSLLSLIAPFTELVDLESHTAT